MAQTVHIFTYEGKIERRLTYLLFLPEAYGVEPDRRWPLLFFLHGALERGGDPNLLKAHGIPRVVEERSDFPFVAVSPQCPEKSGWQLHIVTLGLLLTRIVGTLAVDTDRVYLTGISMGGYGAWHLGARYPERFAAIAPICGYGLVSQGFPARVCNLKELPVWTFHGAMDTIVPLRETETLVDTLRACGGNVHLTVYPDAGHDAWTRTYNNPDLYAWFLQHERGEVR